MKTSHTKPFSKKMTADDVLIHGMRYVTKRPKISLYHGRKSRDSWVNDFKKQFGSDPAVVMKIWRDLCSGAAGVKNRPTPSEMCNGGFRMFLAAHHLLWMYPKNAQNLADTMGICERVARGEPLWRWVSRFAALQKHKIKMPDDINSPTAPHFAAVVDCTDLRRWEPSSNPNYNIDKSWCSFKSKHAAIRFELATSVYEPKIIWLNGWFKAGEMNDYEIFKAGLDLVIDPRKKIIGDSGYKGTESRNKVCIPSSTDSKELANFKARARLRHEGVNGKIKKFKCVQDEAFRHTVEKQALAFTAVVVIVQYQIENGDNDLYDV